MSLVILYYFLIHFYRMKCIFFQFKIFRITIIIKFVTIIQLSYCHNKVDRFNTSNNIVIMYKQFFCSPNQPLPVTFIIESFVG